MLHACAPPKDKAEKHIPREIIQFDSMVDIIVDMQLAEATLHDMKLTGKYNDSLAALAFEKIFAQYHIDKKRYEKSREFYNENLDLNEKIYEKVIEKITRLKDEIDNR
jgi:hypothetical protein